ncbi:hypothetical protein BC834DRAFT_970231 [Gloeopeniophorella convolvens]|nr:hypothetical protein BC834DRAFT_970231 [Gloeopeniophorella convolvens]
MFSSKGSNAQYTQLAVDQPGTSGDGLALPVTPTSSGWGWRLYVPCILVACLSVLNLSLLPFTFSPKPMTDAETAALPYLGQRLGLDRVAASMPHIQWLYQEPEQIVRLNKAIRNGVYGVAPHVYISENDTTIMRFRVPQTGTSVCAITWRGPPTYGGRQKDLHTEGDVSQIEVWSIIGPNSAARLPPGTRAADLDFDTLSWNTRPVSGELLGVVDFTARPNSTTVEFSCPQEDTLTVEMRCPKAGCLARYMHVGFLPKMGLDLVRRQT